MTRFLSRAMALTTILALATPVSYADLGVDPNEVNSGAIHAKDTSLSELCADLRRYETLDAATEAQCNDPKWTGDKTVQLKCKLHEAASTSQAVKFCDARDQSAKARKKLWLAAGVDATAGALCIAEAVTPGAFPPPGTCGYAALSAGAWEMVRVTQQLVTRSHDAGNLKITDDGRVEDKDRTVGLAKQLITGAAPLAAGVIWGLGYFQAKCDKFDNEAKAVDRSAGLRSVNLEKFRQGCVTSTPRKVMGNSNTVTGERARLVRDEAAVSKCMEDAANKEYGQKFGQADQARRTADECPAAKKKLAMKIGLLFTGLAVLRGVNILAADSTVKTSEEALRNLIGEGKVTVTGAITNNGANGGGRYSFGGSVTQGNRSAITADALDEGLPESKMLKNSSLGKSAADFANRMDLANKLDGMVAGGASGMASGIGAMVSSSTGGTAPMDELLAAANSAKPYIAKIDASTSAYASSGGGAGGSKSAPKGDLNLNLGNLMGDGQHEQTAAGVTEDAFRAPAKADSIYHEDTPLNIFQIVSGKIEHIQGESRIQPGSRY